MSNHSAEAKSVVLVTHEHTSVSRRRGSVLMEFILVFPILLILISAILQFAHIWIAREVTAYAAYCATRAVLSAAESEQDNAARCAAEMACSWMALAGFKGSSNGQSESLKFGQENFYNMTDGPVGQTAEEVTHYLNNGAPLSGEVEIPGLGSIPGSDSIKKRIDVHVVKRGGADGGVACVAVQFKFPLVVPLVGRMVSWFANSKSDGLGNAGTVHYGAHKLKTGNKDAWIGQETVMGEDGTLTDRKGTEWGADDKFPVLLLTEACVLPMSYSGNSLPKVGYPSDVPTH